MYLTTPPQQTNDRYRVPRNRQNHTTVDNPLPSQLFVRPGTPDAPSTSQTFERPQKTGILWEPGRLTPPSLRLTTGNPLTQHQRALQQPQSQSRNVSPSTQVVPVRASFSGENADAIMDARKARMSKYLSSWDDTWATASASPRLDLDIGNLTLEESYTAAAIGDPNESVPAAIGETASEIDPRRSPEDSDGGVSLPQEDPHPHPHPQPTTAVQLAELKAKIPWLIEQKTTHGAGWRPLGEYYGDLKDVIP